METKIHPTQKPVKLYDRLLRDFAKPGDKIIDTHGGSMSSAISFYKGGFESVVIEKNERHYDDACKRFKQKTAQVNMFTNKRSIVDNEQGDLFKEKIS